ncbi:MAG: hypothetical protein KDB07_10930, partial [Planctomycetes bacterium]|nr:hypothetical protein [Planctomycetota bacterium]
ATQKYEDDKKLVAAAERRAEDEQKLKEAALALTEAQSLEIEREALRTKELERRDRSKGYLGQASDLLWRGSQIADKQRRLAAMQQALGFAERAVQEDPSFPAAYVWLGNISYDLGHIPSARRYLLQAVEVAEAEGRPVDFATLLTTSMVILSEAVLYSVDESVFVPRFVAIMEQARTSEDTNEQQRRLAELFVDHMPRAFEYQLLAPESPERAQLAQQLRQDALGVQELRLKLEADNSLAYWELSLMEAWHEVQEWRYTPEERATQSPLVIIKRASDLVDSALKIRPQLPLAWSLRSFIRLEAARAASAASNAQPSEKLQEIVKVHRATWQEYIALFPYDAVGHFHFADSATRLFFGRVKGDLNYREAYTKAIELDPESDYARIAFAEALERDGELELARMQISQLIQAWEAGNDFPVERAGRLGLWYTPLARVFAFQARNNDKPWLVNEKLYRKIVAKSGPQKAVRDYYLAVLFDSAHRFGTLGRVGKEFLAALPNDSAAWVDQHIAGILARNAIHEEHAKRLSALAIKKGAATLEAGATKETQPSLKEVAARKATLSMVAIEKTQPSVAEIAAMLQGLRDQYLVTKE